MVWNVAIRMSWYLEAYWFIKIHHATNANEGWQEYTIIYGNCKGSNDFWFEIKASQYWWNWKLCQTPQLSYVALLRFTPELYQHMLPYSVKQSESELSITQSYLSL